MRKLTTVVVMGLVSVLGLVSVVAAAPNGAGGVTGPAFYVEGALYRTVGTPTDLSHTGAPAHSYDNIYVLGDNQAPVADAAPGLPGYNGGRWLARPVSFNTDYATTLAAHDLDGSGAIDSIAELDSAFGDAGAAGATASDVVASFECPVIPLAKGPKGG